FVGVLASVFKQDRCRCRGESCSELLRGMPHRAKLRISRCMDTCCAECRVCPTCDIRNSRQTDLGRQSRVPSKWRNETNPFLISVLRRKVEFVAERIIQHTAQYCNHEQTDCWNHPLARPIRNNP